MLSNKGLCLCSMHSMCHYFSTGGKVSNFTELHGLTLAACSYALLYIPYGDKFLWDKIFMVFADLPQTAKILTAKFYPQCKPHPFLAIGTAYFRSGWLQRTDSDAYQALFDIAAPLQRLHSRYLHKCSIPHHHFKH